MKIFCIGRNYVEHARELNNEVPETPVIFMKPPTALLKDGRPFYYPDFSKNIHFEGELVLKISKNGKNIEEQFAHNYFEEISIGLDLTARDIQGSLKEKGLPWEIAKGFDGAAPIGGFIRVNELQDNDSIRFHLLKNGETVQRGDTSLMLFSFAQLISYISKYFTLQKGDLIYTGTPAGVGPVQVGDVFEGFIENNKLLNCTIK